MVILMVMVMVMVMVIVVTYNISKWDEIFVNEEEWQSVGRSGELVTSSANSGESELRGV